MRLMSTQTETYIRLQNFIQRWPPMWTRCCRERERSLASNAGPAAAVPSHCADVKWNLLNYFINIFDSRPTTAWHWQSWCHHLFLLSSTTATSDPRIRTMVAYIVRQRAQQFQGPVTANTSYKVCSSPLCLPPSCRPEEPALLQEGSQ